MDSLKPARSFSAGIFTVTFNIPEMKEYECRICSRHTREKQIH